MNLGYVIAELMLKFITKICNKYKGLGIEKYSKLSGETIYKLEWSDSN
jgi:hypothetical protein